MKKAALLLLLLFCVRNAVGQSIQSSNTYIQTKYHHALHYSVNNSSYLYYDESKQSLYLKIDFSKFKTGNDSLDDWLNDLSGTFFYLKFEIDKQVFQNGFTNHQHKTLQLKGQAYLNGIWQTQDVELSLYSIENSVQGTNTNTNVYENIRLNFGLAILPKDFKIHKKAHHLKKVINIGITLGRINLLLPGMEKELQEIYDHH